ATSLQRASQLPDPSVQEKVAVIGTKLVEDTAVKNSRLDQIAEQKPSVEQSIKSARGVAERAISVQPVQPAQLPAPVVVLAAATETAVGAPAPTLLPTVTPAPPAASPTAVPAAPALAAALLGGAATPSPATATPRPSPTAVRSPAAVGEVMI